MSAGDPAGGHQPGGSRATKLRPTRTWFAPDARGVGAGRLRYAGSDQIAGDRAMSESHLSGSSG